LIVSGALSQALGEGPANLISVELKTKIDPENDVLMDVDSGLTRLNDGIIVIGDDSVDQVQTTDVAVTSVSSWMLH